MNLLKMKNKIEKLKNQRLELLRKRLSSAGLITSMMQITLLFRQKMRKFFFILQNNSFLVGLVTSKMSLFPKFCIFLKVRRKTNNYIFAMERDQTDTFSNGTASHFKIINTTHSTSE